MPGAADSSGERVPGLRRGQLLGETARRRKAMQIELAPSIKPTYPYLHIVKIPIVVPHRDLAWEGRLVNPLDHALARSVCRHDLYAIADRRRDDRFDVLVAHLGHGSTDLPMRLRTAPWSSEGQGRKQSYPSG